MNRQTISGLSPARGSTREVARSSRRLSRGSETPLRQPARRPHFVLTFLAVLFSIGSVQAADPATVSFSLDFPKSNPERYSIVVHSDGRAHYESSGRLSDDSDEESYEADFALPESSCAHIFELAAQAQYFSGKIDSGNKKLAFTGAKKLAYKDPQRDSSADYNYSSLVPVQRLTALFQSMEATLEHGRRLSYFYRYQKLSLDEELKRMEDEGRRGELSEIQAVKPVLQSIYDDSSVMNVVRARAGRIMQMSSNAVPR